MEHLLGLFVLVAIALALYWGVNGDDHSIKH